MSFYQMHRGWLDSDMFADAAYDERSAWTWMIGEARWADGVIAVKGSPLALKRGQLYTSIRFMSIKFQWSTNRVLRFLDRLKKWGAIGVSTETGQSLITICNYEEYQSTGDTSGDAIGDSDGDTSGDKQEEIQRKTKKGNNILPKPEDVSDKTWQDFKIHRKSKKAAITETVIEGFRLEAEKAGISLELALRETQLRNWQGFKADWYLNAKGKENGNSSFNSSSGIGNKQTKSSDALKAALAGLEG